MQNEKAVSIGRKLPRAVEESANPKSFSPCRKKRARRAIGGKTSILLIFSLLISLPLLLQFSSAGEPRVIRVGAYENPPKLSISGNGEVTGFWAELLQYIAGQENWQLKYVPGTWEDGLANLQNGKIDLMPDVAFTPERAKQYIFSEGSVLTSWSRIYVHKNNKDIETIRDLRNKKIGGLRGSVNIEGPGGIRELNRSFNLNATIIGLDNYQEVFRAIEKGEIDAGPTNRNFGNRYASDYAVRETPIIFQPMNLKIALPKNKESTPYLVQRINTELKRLKSEEKSIYYRLLERYFEAEIAEKEVAVIPPWLKLFLEIAVGVILFFTLLIIFSRIEVRRKTEEIRAKNKELKTSGEKYQAIYNSPSDAIFIHDAVGGGIADVNQATYEMYGYTREEILGHNIGDLSAGDAPYSQSDASEWVKRTLSQGPQRFDWRARRKNGDLFWVEVSLQHTEIGGKSYIIAVVRDIEERKQAEAALAAEKERLRVTLVSIGDGVIVTDTEGRVVMLSRVAENLTGWEHREANGRPLPEIFNIINENTGEKCESPVAEVLKFGKIIGLENNTMLIARDGTKRSIADSAAPIFDRENKIIGVTLVFRDVTEKKKTAAELEKIKKLEAVGVLAGGIAHDFNNILTAILGNISLAKSYVYPHEKAAGLLQSAEKASERARSLTQQLLTFSKGGYPVKKTTSIAKVITDSAGFILRGSSVACHFNIPEDLWLVEIDTGQISRVIQNIILNARQAMPEGGDIRIDCANISDISAEGVPHLSGDRFIRISIQDNGRGISPENLEKIFDPYFSTKADGSGLGLAITHSIIRKHDGNIRVLSSRGEGTTFAIYLPAKDRHAAEIPSTPETEAVSGSVTVLVMDDDEMVRQLAGEMLECLGHQVLFAETGEEAIRIYQEYYVDNHPIDLLIMDLTIPGGMGGKEATQEHIKINPDARVIVASGYSIDPVMANYAQYGFRGTIAKPFKLSDLRDTINNVLAN